jgi:hypothetical protein
MNEMKWFAAFYFNLADLGFMKFNNRRVEDVGFFAFCYHCFFSSVFLSFSLNQCQWLGNCDIRAERKILVMNEMKWFAAFYFNLAVSGFIKFNNRRVEDLFFLLFATIISSLQSFCHFLSTSASS